jgi:hypothetical protein
MDIVCTAGTHVRNAATIGGNLTLARERHLESDLATVLMGAGAKVLWKPLSGCTDGHTSRWGLHSLLADAVYRRLWTTCGRGRVLLLHCTIAARCV